MIGSTVPQLIAGSLVPKEKYNSCASLHGCAGHCLPDMTISRPQQNVKDQDTFQEIQHIGQKLLSAGVISPRELLFYQVKVGEFNLRVELLSKCAEGVSASLRKLQQGA